MNFKFFGVCVEISYIFACTLVLFIANDKTGVFLPFLISVIIHELAHILLLLIFGCKLKRVKLLFGTVGLEYEENIKDSEKLFSLAAGPFSNLLAAVAFFSLGFKTLFVINLVLAIYNLFPIKGLDGGDILEILLSRFATLKTIKIIQFTSSLLILIPILFLAVLNAKVLFTNYSLILFSLYLILQFVFKKLG